MTRSQRRLLALAVLSMIGNAAWAASAGGDAEEIAKWQLLQSQDGAYQPLAGSDPGPVVQGVAGYSGTNAGGPTFQRPGQGVPPTSLSGNIVNYHLEQFTISANSPCTLYSDQDYDGYLHVYEGSFNPADSFANVIGGDDDVFTNPFRDSQIDIELFAGITYYLVTSSFGAGGTGNFTNTVTCPAADVTIGEPLPPTSANLRVSLSGPTIPVRSGTSVPVYLRLDNYGPDAAYPPTIEFTSTSSPGSVSVTAPSGWICDDNGGETRPASKATPAVAVLGAVIACTAEGNMARGSARFAFRVTAPANPPGGFVTLNASVSSESVDPVSSNNSASFKLYVKPSDGSISPVVPSIR
jgi:hypothetical protein